MHGSGVVDVGRGRESPEVHPGELVEDPVVEEDVRAVQAGDDHVLVVARIAEDRVVRTVPVLRAGYVLVPPAAADLQFRADRAVGVRLVQVRAEPGATPEDGGEVQHGGTGGGGHRRGLWDAGAGCLGGGGGGGGGMAPRGRPRGAWSGC